MMRVESSVIEDLAGVEPDGLMGRVGERFPLGRGMRPRALDDEPPSGPRTRPFGLRYLTLVEAQDVRVLNLSEVTYDPESQMSRLAEELLIHAKTRQGTEDTYDTQEDHQVYPDTDTDEVHD